MSFPFNVRVYGILELKKHILLSTESYLDRTFTKFPGGALEFGEGLKDALKREFQEETGLSVKVLDHIYTTDFFQTSAFDPNHQIISIYYGVRFEESFETLPEIIGIENNHRFFWVEKAQLNSTLVTFPIDKILIQILLS